MSSSIRHFFMTLGVVALGAISLPAQIRNMETAQIPFAFHVRGADLPPGDYVVKTLGRSNTLEVMNAATSKGVLVMTGPAEPTRSLAGKLVFHRYGEQYFLAEIWTPDGQSHAVPVSTLEKEMSKTDTFAVLEIRYVHAD